MSADPITTPPTGRLRALGKPASEKHWFNAFWARLSLALALLLLGFGALVAVLGQRLATEQEQEALQRLSRGLAQHIVGHWPEVSAVQPGRDEQAARQALMQMLMVVNPGIQVYVLDADGRVDAYIGEPGMVRLPTVDLAPVREFLAGAALPLFGSDPMGSGRGTVFSAAMFAPRQGDARPPGYLYIVLDGDARARVAASGGLRRLWQGAAVVAGAGLLATMLLGLLLFRRLSQPLQRLAGRMHDFGLAGPGSTPATAPQAAGRGGADEVRTIAEAFHEMSLRINRQARAQALQAAAHRELMASLAHDLRSPLTALHGHLEALDSGCTDDGPLRQRLQVAALAQSDKVRRLSQQLFELATLQASAELPQRERFRLDELVTDAVQKFDLPPTADRVMLDGPPPGRVELEGDLHLIERALTNLIDNAVRHAPPEAPVRVSLRLDGAQVQLLVEDAGPGLPDELARRLQAGQPVREPAQRRPGGGVGGLGLAIAQRIAVLHGGSLRLLPAPQGGTRLCLALPAPGLSGPTVARDEPGRAG